MIDSINTIIYTCIFLLPGGIINGIVRRISPSYYLTSPQQLILWLGYSVCNNAIWSWSYITLYKNVSSKSISFWILLIIIIIITSTLTGIILGLIRDKDVVRKLAGKIGVSIEHPIPTAWDYVLSKQKASCYMIVALVDGTKYYGYFGYNSFASSNNMMRDIYLENVYKLNDKKEWIIEPGRSILVNSNQISSIEIINEGSDENEQK